jgi:hypothetical protein
MKTNTGGPAIFAQANEAAKRQSASVGVPYQAPSGMTLRDYFAAKVLQGFCAGAVGGDDIEGFPKLSYLIADAMLKAREVKA